MKYFLAIIISVTFSWLSQAQEIDQLNGTWVKYYEIDKDNDTIYYGKLDTAEDSIKAIETHLNFITDYDSLNDTTKNRIKDLFFTPHQTFSFKPDFLIINADSIKQSYLGKFQETTRNDFNKKIKKINTTKERLIFESLDTNSKLTTFIYQRIPNEQNNNWGNWSFDLNESIKAIQNYRDLSGRLADSNEIVSLTSKLESFNPKLEFKQSNFVFYSLTGSSNSLKFIKNRNFFYVIDGGFIDHTIKLNNTGRKSLLFYPHNMFPIYFKMIQ